MAKTRGVQRSTLCCERSEGIRKGTWTLEEDEKLIAYVQKHGHDNWRALPRLAGLQRCGKSCRLRWINYLRPDVKRGNFTKEEEESIIKLHSSLGNKWSKIASHLPGRTDNEIKNVWNTYLKRKIQVRNTYVSSRQRKLKARTTRSSSSSTDDSTPRTCFSDQSQSSGSSSEGKDAEFKLRVDSLAPCRSTIDSCTTFQSEHQAPENSTINLNDQAAAPPPEIWRFIEEDCCSPIPPNSVAAPLISEQLEKLEDQKTLQSHCPLNSEEYCSKDVWMEIPSVAIDEDLELWQYVNINVEEGSSSGSIEATPDQGPQIVAEYNFPTFCNNQSTAIPQDRASIWEAEKNIWLAHLEKELGL